MQSFPRLNLSTWLCALCAVSTMSDSAGAEDLASKLERLEQRVQALEHENAKLRASNTSATSSPSSSPAIKGLQGFNPELGVIADIVGTLSESKEDAEGNDRLAVREVEVVFGHDIDPYSRLDVTLAFSDEEDPEVEEAYASFFSLPGDLKSRLGRFRPKVGKASPLHRDSLETVDVPLVIQSYLGVEGLSRTGAELSGFLPLPWENLTHELTLGLLEGGVGEEGSLFGETRRRPSFYGHLKNFWDISDETNFQLGGTYMLGSSDEDSSNEVQAFGIDATLVHHVTPQNKLKWQNEIFIQDRDETTVELEDGSSFDADSSPLGFYSLLDYRLSERWGLGGRYDYVEPVNLDPEAARDADTAYSAYLTFYQSEFARWRAQYQHLRMAEGGEDDRFFLQGTFAIGVHKHALQ